MRRTAVIAAVLTASVSLITPPVRADRYIRVQGRLVYDRPPEKPGDSSVRIPVDRATVIIWDQDDDFFDQFDDKLAWTHTDSDGYFDTKFYYDENCQGCELNPDLYVQFLASNEFVNVTDWHPRTYSWVSSTRFDFSGSTRNIGTYVARDGDPRALNIHNTITRAAQWLKAHHGYNMPVVEARFVGIADFYEHITRRINYTGATGYNDGRILHEYGHHWINSFGDYEEFLGIPGSQGSYDNGYCDGAWPVSGHCAWCEENSIVAWQEGFPHWFSDVVGRGITEDSGYEILDQPDFEYVHMCSQDNPDRFHEPNTTEGFLAAVLRDIEDDAASSFDDDHTDNVGDVLALGAGPVFRVAAEDEPTTPFGFLMAFLRRYPKHAETLWETAKSCGYEIDLQPPQAPTGLRSPTHPVGTVSRSTQVTLEWKRPADDASGVMGYSITLSTDARTAPDPFRNIDDVTSYTTDALEPGEYYFAIRSIDRSGKASPTHAVYGPIVIGGRVFRRGDTDDSGGVELSDAMAILGFLFRGKTPPACNEAADVDNSGRIDVADASALLNYLFLGGPAPGEPGPGRSCGPDPDEPGSEGDLGCREFTSC